MMQQSQRHTSTCCREGKLQCFCYFLSLGVGRNLLRDESETSQKMCYRLRRLKPDQCAAPPHHGLSASFENTASGLVLSREEQ